MAGEGRDRKSMIEDALLRAVDKHGFDPSLVDFYRAKSRRQWGAPSGDTRTFQQYDPNNARAQEQLRPAYQALTDPINATIGGDEAAQGRVLQKVGQAMTDPMMVGAIKAYHGTPHTFTPLEGKPFGQFEKSAIGSGEGAAAYGHGASYSAETEGVAKEYQKQLKGLKNDKSKKAGFLAD